MNIQLINEPNIGGLAQTMWLKEVCENDTYPFGESISYGTSVSDLDYFKAKASYHWCSNHYEEMFILQDEGVYRLRRDGEDVAAIIAAKSREQLTAIKSEILEYLPKHDNNDPNQVRVAFWSNGSNGPSSVSRQIEVPLWDEIELNYTKSVAEKLDFMMTDFVPAHGGQLVLWEGSPGTGKTYALRALAQSWREWASFHYITDPEEFFGNANYMIQVLLGGNHDDFDYYDDEGIKVASQEKWRVLILEDCGELLSADAKERTGQAVARLLNVVDGLIGQGLKLLVLVTTNEPVKKFHTAITRPGRCAMHLEYKPLAVDEVASWLKAHKIDPKVLTSEATVAELFAEVEGWTTAGHEEVKFGFAA